VRSASIVRVANDQSDRDIPRAVAVAAVAVGLAAVALAVIMTGAAKPQLLLDPGAAELKAYNAMLAAKAEVQAQESQEAQDG